MRSSSFHDGLFLLDVGMQVAAQCVVRQARVSEMRCRCQGRSARPPPGTLEPTGWLPPPGTHTGYCWHLPATAGCHMAVTTAGWLQLPATVGCHVAARQQPPPTPSGRPGRALGPFGACRMWCVYCQHFPCFSPSVTPNPNAHSTSSVSKLQMANAAQHQCTRQASCDLMLMWLDHFDNPSMISVWPSL